jgi:transcriptional regulator with XRE-family HTH domain
MPRRHRKPRFPRAELIRAREQRGWNRPQFAEIVGLDRATVFSVEMGQRHLSLKTMFRWIEALGAGATMALWPKADLDKYLHKARLIEEAIEPDRQTAA